MRCYTNLSRGDLSQNCEIPQLSLLQKKKKYERIFRRSQKKKQSLSCHPVQIKRSNHTDNINR